MKLYVTYGFGSAQFNCYSVVEGADIDECYDTIHAVCGQKYSFVYTERDFAGQVEEFGLTEIPLQAQTRENLLSED